MKRIDNPFILKPFETRELFCDRKEEMDKLMEYVFGGSDVTLFSPRRMGKTGLIMRTFDEIKSRYPDVLTFYVDIFNTESVEDFNKKLTEAVVSALRKESAIKKFLKFISHLRPALSYNPLTSEPEVTLTYRDDWEKKTTIEQIFEYLKSLDKEMVIAIDEFQQIRKYPGVAMEATLRSIIQFMPKIRFIFCGSRKHLMVEMFTDARRPFYESTSFMYLHEIRHESYKDFIIRQFRNHGRDITDEAIGMILEWTRRHTFYTQKLCNTIFNIRRKQIDRNDVIFAVNRIFEEYEERFLEIRNLITPAQWNFLRAVAKEGTVDHPTAKDFLAKYNIGTPANARRCLESLIEKELLLAIPNREGISYRVYNVFLSRWFESL